MCNMLDMNNIHCMDCNDALELLDDECIDLVISDPPYLATNTHEDMNQYIMSMRDAFGDMLRVVKPTGSLYIFSSLNISYQLARELVGCGWHHKNTIVMRKNNVLTRMQSTNYWSVYNPILFFTKRSQGYQFHPPNDLNRSVRTNTWAFDVSSGFLESGHAPQNRAVLMNAVKIMIQTSSSRDDVVLDPFCGVGTVLQVARDLHRRYIGFEISQDMFSEALNNIQRDNSPIDDDDMFGDRIPDLQSILDAARISVLDGINTEDTSDEDIVDRLAVDE